MLNGKLFFLGSAISPSLTIINILFQKMKSKITVYGKKFLMATFTSAKDFVEVKTRLPIKLIRCSNYKTAKQYLEKLQVSDKE